MGGDPYGSGRCAAGTEPAPFGSGAPVRRLAAGLSSGKKVPRLRPAGGRRSEAPEPNGADPVPAGAWGLVAPEAWAPRMEDSPGPGSRVNISRN